MSKDKNDSAPDSVNRTTESRIPGDVFHIGPDVHKTVIEKDADKYTGYGRSREDADKSAGDKYREGKKD